MARAPLPWIVAAAAALFVAAAASAVPVQAAVEIEGATGFKVNHEARVDAAPADAYAAFLDIAAWWSPDHTFSGDAGRLSITLAPGGCWCETLPGGGFVEHMRLVQAAPGARLVFHGGLGPLNFMGVAGAMTLTFAAEGAGRTTVSLAYQVAGADAAGLGALAPAVDAVLGAQMARYARFASRGAPDGP